MKYFLALSFFFLSGCSTYRPAMSAYSIPNYERVKAFCDDRIRGDTEKHLYEQEVCWFAVTEWEYLNDHYEVEK